MEAHGARSDVAIARAIREAVRRVPGVAEISAGPRVVAATYGPGERVEGVVVRRDAEHVDLEVHVAAVYAPSLSLPALAEAVRRAAREQAEALGARPVRRVDVAFDDLHMDGGGRR